MRIIKTKSQLDKTLESVKENIVDRIFLFTFFILLPALLTSLLRINLTGFSLVYVLQILLLLSVLLVYLFRKSLNLKFKGYAFAIILFLAAVSGVYRFGYFGEAKILLIIIPLVATLFFGKKEAFMSIGIILVLMTVMAYLFWSGMLVYDFNIVEYTNRSIPWIILIFVLITVMTIMVVVISKTMESQQEALKNQLESNEQITSIAHSIPGVVFQFRVPQDKPYYFSYISRKAIDIFGVGVDPDSNHWNEFKSLHPDDKEALMSSINECIKTKSEWSFEGRMINRDKEVKWFKGLSSPHEMDDELVYNGVLLDITNEKEAEIRIKHEKRFNESIINNLPGIFYSHRIDDGKFYLERWNNNLVYELGYAAEELHGLELGKCVPKSEFTKLKKALDQFFNTGEFEIEIILLTKEGSRIPYLLNGQLFDGGTHQYLFGVGMNISDLKEAQSELNRHKNHLSTLVELKTQKLKNVNKELRSTNEELKRTLDQLKNTQQRLIHTEKMASIGNFVSGIAHEVNNPLNFIAGGQSILGKTLNEESEQLKKDINEDLQLSHQMISDGMSRVQNIVKTLMTFSYSGESVKTERQLEKIIDNTILFIHKDIPDKIKIIKEYGLEKAIPVFEDKVHQVILNILDNGIFSCNQYQGSEKRMVRIKTEMVESYLGDHFAKLSIFNTGDPIPKDNLRQLFDPFYTTKSPGQGSGLGLSISYSIMQEHGGEILVENVQNGVEFSLYFPTETTQEAIHIDDFSGTH